MQINAVTDPGKQLVCVSNMLPQVGRSVGRLLEVFHTSLHQMYRCETQRAIRMGRSVHDGVRSFDSGASYFLTCNCFKRVCGPSREAPLPTVIAEP